MRRGEWNLPEMRDVLDPEEYQLLWQTVGRRRMDAAFERDRKHDRLRDRIWACYANDGGKVIS